MGQVDKMFQVIVAGGIALATPAVTAAVAGCGGSTTTASDGGFPTEGPQAADGFPQETAAQPDAFPQEGPPPQLDSGLVVDASDAAAATDGETSDAPCFPQETALPLDSGCTR
jgi:hypothetical protein